MKPLIKVKNPALRYLSGAVMFALGVGMAIAISYGMGLITASILRIDRGNFWGVVGGGFASLMLLVCGLFLAFIAICGIYEGVRYLGNKFFDP